MQKKHLKGLNKLFLGCLTSLKYFAWYIFKSFLGDIHMAINQMVYIQSK